MKKLATLSFPMEKHRKGFSNHVFRLFHANITLPNKHQKSSSYRHDMIINNFPENINFHQISTVRKFSYYSQCMDSTVTSSSFEFNSNQTTPTNVLHFAFSQEDVFTESPKDGVYFQDHLIVLNTPYFKQKLFPRELFEGLWNSCRWKFCADGGANRLFQYTNMNLEMLKKKAPHPSDTRESSDTTFLQNGFNLHLQKQFIPDMICGDLDSLDQAIGNFYSKQGTSIMKISEQDSNDLQKCVSLLKEKILQDAISENKPKIPQIRTLFHRVFIIGGGGRLDQEMCDLNTLYIEAMAGLGSSSSLPSSSLEFNTASPSLTIKKEEIQPPEEEHRYHHQTTSRSIITTTTEKHALQFILVTPYSLVYVLKPGKHEIYRNSKWERSTCALVPIGVPCQQVMTSGLQWNLKGERLEFGGLVSTSNRMLQDCVTVQNSHPLLWITSLNNQAEEEC
nr:unnamed protein product [Naegleria fowleri]